MTENEFWKEFKTGKLVINCNHFAEQFIIRCKQNKIEAGYSYPKDLYYFRFSDINNSVLCGDIYDYKDRYKIVYYLDIFKKNKGEKVKYKLLKLLTGEEIYKAGACVGDREKFINHFGFSKTVDWNEENENWITENIPNGIEWGIKNGFIEKINEIEYNKNKVYCFKTNETNRVYILARVTTTQCSWVCLSDSNSCYNGVCFINQGQAIDHAVKCKFTIETFDNIQEALNNYFPKPSSKLPISKTDRINILYDLIEEFDVEHVNCQDSRFDCREIDCNDCKFKSDWHEI